jgi:hypothetical protein
MDNLSVEIRDLDIIVTTPSNGQSVTYRNDRLAPMLVALDPMNRSLNDDRLTFLAKAWNAAYTKAKELGWL